MTMNTDKAFAAMQVAMEAALAATRRCAGISVASQARAVKPTAPGLSLQPPRWWYLERPTTRSRVAPTEA